jgi:hypothetical protein
LVSATPQQMFFFKVRSISIGEIDNAFRQINNCPALWTVMAFIIMEGRLQGPGLRRSIV